MSAIRLPWNKKTYRTKNVPKWKSISKVIFVTSIRLLWLHLTQILPLDCREVKRVQDQNCSKMKKLQGGFRDQLTFQSIPWFKTFSLAPCSSGTRRVPHRLGFADSSKVWLWTPILFLPQSKCGIWVRFGHGYCKIGSKSTLEMLLHLGTVFVRSVFLFYTSPNAGFESDLAMVTVK